MLSRSLGNKGWEKKCSVKYSCNESTKIKQEQQWKQLHMYCYKISSCQLTCHHLAAVPIKHTHKLKLTMIAALLLMESIIILVPCVCEYFAKCGKWTKKVIYDQLGSIESWLWLFTWLSKITHIKGCLFLFIMTIHSLCNQLCCSAFEAPIFLLESAMLFDPLGDCGC